MVLGRGPLLARPGDRADVVRGPGLFAVPLRQPAVRPLPSTWRNPGMAQSDTRSVQFSARLPFRSDNPAIT
jgi:hypothetical protein